MDTGRVEAFSDGVVAIIITIMVLELRAPVGEHMADLKPLIPALAGYVLSFIYVGIYWNNHHHMMRAVRRIDGRVLWSNLYLLFWLSTVPFVTAWMGSHPMAEAPAALYGFVLLMNALAWVVLQRALLQANSIEPTPDQIADVLGVPTERVIEVLRLAQEPVSLHAPVGEEDDVALGDLIEDADAESPADSVAVMMLREHLDTLLPPSASGRSGWSSCATA